MCGRYGYGGVAEYQGIVDGYAGAGIPLETFVSDSQYMDHDQDFTLGAKFPPGEMQAFVAGLHSRGQRWVSTRPDMTPTAHVCPCTGQGVWASTLSPLTIRP